VKFSKIKRKRSVSSIKQEAVIPGPACRQAGLTRGAGPESLGIGKTGFPIKDFAMTNRKKEFIDRL
jgi:hypothetical protein